MQIIVRKIDSKVYPYAVLGKELVSEQQHSTF